MPAAIPTPMLTVIADDLSGAQECIAAATQLTNSGTDDTGPSAAAMLSGHSGSLPTVQSLAIDIDSRTLGSEAAAARCTAALTDLHNTPRIDEELFFKFDSLLRGPIAAQLRAASKVVGPLVFCPAVPELNRTLLDGVMHVNGIPLHETDLWHLEPDLAPESVFDLFAELYTIKVGLSEVRSGQLAERFHHVSIDTQVLICDAETKEDLDRIVSAARATGSAMTGASGLCAALARSGSPGVPLQQLTLTGRDPGVLFVIGTASQQARAQVRMLAEPGIPVIEWKPGDIIELPGGDCVITIAGPVRHEESLGINSSLAQLIAAQSHGRDLFLTGGQTARSILNTLRIPLLKPLSQPEFGTVFSATDDGRLIATRPGSFGSPDSLIRSHNTFKNLRSSSERTLP